MAESVVGKFSILWWLSGENITVLIFIAWIWWEGVSKSEVLGELF